MGRLLDPGKTSGKNLCIKAWGTLSLKEKKKEGSDKALEEKRYTVSISQESFSLGSSPVLTFSSGFSRNKGLEGLRGQTVRSEKGKKTYECKDVS